MPDGEGQGPGCAKPNVAARRLAGWRPGSSCGYGCVWCGVGACLCVCVCVCVQACRQPWARNKQGVLFPPAALGRARIAQPGPLTTVPRLRLKYALQAPRASLSLQSSSPCLALRLVLSLLSIWPQSLPTCVVAGFASGTPISSHLMHTSIHPCPRPS